LYKKLKKKLKIVTYTETLTVFAVLFEEYLNIQQCKNIWNSRSVWWNNATEG